jgi:hypothetical protein
MYQLINFEFFQRLVFENPTSADRQIDRNSKKKIISIIGTHKPDDPSQDLNSTYLYRKYKIYLLLFRAPYIFSKVNIKAPRSFIPCLFQDTLFILYILLGKAIG